MSSLYTTPESERLKKMSPEQRSKWWVDQAQRDYKKYGGRGVDDLGPEIPAPVGKMRCHGIRKKMHPKGEWWKEPAAQWYHQGSLGQRKL